MTRSPRCPICGGPVARPDDRAKSPSPAPPQKSFFPFCSDRCRMVDLNRWLTGEYAIPGDRIDPVAPSEDGAEDG